MDRRRVLVALPLLALRPASAHHGWSGFDQTRPLWLEGRAAAVAWRNPHVEFDLELPADARLPADLAARSLPAQTAAVDGPALLQAATLPKRRDRRWHVELAPITRMEAWKVPPIKDGDNVAVLGYAADGERGEPVLRAEYLFAGGRVYGLRSSPA